jgi:hypothetical protein
LVDIFRETLVHLYILWKIRMETKPPKVPKRSKPVSLTPPLTEKDLEELLKDVKKFLNDGDG